MTTTTKHKPDCNMSFGRKDATCPRCQELIAGAPARAGWQRSYFATKANKDAARLLAIRTHDCKRDGCGPVCVAFDY